MKRLFITYLLAFALCLFTTAAGIDDPHGTTNSIYCGECHITHNTLGDILVNATDSLVSTLCLSCHTPGGWVSMNKTLSSADQAEPGISGTSHAWDSHVINPDRGSDMPQSQVLLDHLSADSSVTCGTCHDPHSNSTPPFLRVDNSADALCLDCHSPRNMSSVRTYTGNPLSHPISQVLSASSTYHFPPFDVDGNPQPSDGNTTNDYKLGTGNEVRCTTCHGIHYTDSESSTVDGP
jgi:predicted CXXCH cytochrome family protein